MSTPKQKPPHDSTKKQEMRTWLLRVGFQSGALLATFLLGIVLLGLAQKIGWLSSAAGTASVEQGADRETIYTCPMHPEVRQNEPGKCPICGMTLVEAPSNKPVEVTATSSRYLCPMM